MTEIRIGQLDLRDLSTSDLGSANAVANLESNIVSVATTVNAAIDTVSANADTLTTLLNTVSGNIDAAATLVSTISGNADTFASLVISFASYGNTNFAEGTYIDGEVANLIASAPTALNTLQELATAINNDATFFDTITGLADTVNANTASIASNIDGIQSNLDSYATYANSQFGASSNISLTVGNTTISNSTIFVEGARSSVYANTNTTSKTLTFTHTMGNATSQEFTMNGSTNALTLGSTATSNTNMYFVFYNGLALKPDEYSVSGSTMTLANVDPIISGSNVEVRYLDFFGFRETATSGGGVYSFQGSNFGYNAGGSGGTDIIDKFPFSSDSNAVDVGELAVAASEAAGSSSSTDGYASGGYSPNLNNIQKFPFTSDTSSSDIANLTVAQRLRVGQSSSTSGYVTGGGINAGTIDLIDKFPFSSDTNAIDIGELVSPISYGAGQSSSDNGYYSGGFVPSYSDIIQKFPFSSDTNSTDVAELTRVKRYLTGQSSSTHGYITGGAISISASTDVIEKFPFSSDTSASDIANLTAETQGGSGNSSTENGYFSRANIDKFSFTSDADATNIGSLTTPRALAASQQY